MDKLNTVYTNLTGVDIEKQKQIWDERGKGYYGEYLVFEELYRFVPGNGKILMNLEVPSQYGNNTEIDLVFIHETGIYVFEIKHYKGTIYGKSEDERWTQYFRTVKNSHFYSPLLQNKGHIKALKNILPTAKFTSFIVFTNEDCDLRVSNDDPDVIICKLHELERCFAERTRNAKPAYGMEGIDRVFTELLPYSPSMNEKVTVDGEIAPLSSFIHLNKNKTDTENSATQTSELPLAAYLNEIRSKYQKYAALIYEDAQKQVGRAKRNTALAVCVALIICGVLAYFTNVRVQKAEASFEEQMAAMRQNFQHVEAYNAGDIALSDDFVIVTSAALSKSKELSDATEFSSKIQINSDSYLLKFTKDTQFVVMMKDGRVQEYDMFPDGSMMNLSSTLAVNLAWDGPVDFGKMVFYNTEPENVEYIKLKGVSLCDGSLYDVMKDDIELELYSAE